MKIFISWSGELSHRMALLLKDWLEDVIQSIDAYVSSEAIDKGARWLSDISVELEDTDFGIICLTPENIAAPWILFEAGALSKCIDKSRVCPLLFNLSSIDIVGPLVQFQACNPKKGDMLSLIQTINKVLDEKALGDKKLLKSFTRCWSEFEANLKKAQKTITIPEKIQRPPDDILDEILQLCRNISSATQTQGGQRLTQADISYIAERVSKKHFGPYHYYMTIKPIEKDVLNEFARELNDTNILRGLSSVSDDNKNILIDIKTTEPINPIFLMNVAKKYGINIVNFREGMGL